MSRKRKTEIMIEIDRTILYTRRCARERQWCEGCAAKVEMITAFEAAQLAGVSAYTICSKAEQGQVHSTFTSEGLLLLCLNSLPR